MYEIPQEVLDFFGKFSWFHKSNIILDQSDGLLIYNRNLYLYQLKSMIKVPEIFLHFKEVEGNLDFSFCKNLRNIENLRNLRRVGGYLSLSNTAIENLKGLENLEYIGGHLGLENCKHRKDLNGLNPEVNIVGTDGVIITPINMKYYLLEWLHYASIPIKYKKSVVGQELLKYIDAYNLELSDDEIVSILVDVENISGVSYV